MLEQQRPENNRKKVLRFLTILKVIDTLRKKSVCYKLRLLANIVGKVRAAAVKFGTTHVHILYQLQEMNTYSVGLTVEKMMNEVCPGKTARVYTIYLFSLR